MLWYDTNEDCSRGISDAGDQRIQPQFFQSLSYGDVLTTVKWKYEAISKQDKISESIMKTHT